MARPARGSGASIDQGWDLKQSTQAPQDSQAYDGGALQEKTLRSTGEASLASMPSRIRPGHQRLVFPDPVAFRYLQESPSAEVVESDAELVGYELYLVEQWACSRKHPTFVITTFTGLPHHKVSVGVLSVPVDQNEWSPRLRVYLNAVSNYHARKKETSLGTLMVTNLSSFPSALTVITVPGGKFKNYRQMFIVNEDMKRLGCSGRAGLTLSAPSGATEAKFKQLYHTDDRVPVAEAVIELVKLCQVALVMFTKLAPEYVDGLLCDVTERAINDWWTEVGVEYLTVEPSDGILGPTTVSALLGLFLGARNRLNAFGAPVSKDAFELKTMKRGISYFQKALKLTRTRRLDHQTLERLHRSTTKAANSEGWTVPRAVKSTVAELSGKGGEMVMGMVGGRDKAGIAEVETLDIDKFTETISGERCKWLWQGKPRKTRASDFFSNFTGDDEAKFNGDENGGYSRSSRKREPQPEQTTTGHSRLDHLYVNPAHGSQSSLETSDKDQAFRKAVLKSVTDRMSDARSGLGRFRDVVGIIGHYHKSSAEIITAPPPGSLHNSTLNKSSANSLVEAFPAPLEDKSAARAQLDSLSSDKEILSRDDADVNIPTHITSEIKEASPPLVSESATAHSDDPGSTRLSGNMDSLQEVGRLGLPGPSRLEKLSTQSLCMIPATDSQTEQLSLGLPRSVSFSAVEGIVFPQATASNGPTAQYLGGPRAIRANERLEFFKARRMAARLQNLHEYAVPNVEDNAAYVEELELRSTRDCEELQVTCKEKLDEYHSLRRAIADLIGEERTSIFDALKEAEGFGAKLEYELNTLVSKVEDVEDSVAAFGRQVLELEERTQELQGEESRTDSWLWRFFAGQI